MCLFECDLSKQDLFDRMISDQFERKSVLVFKDKNSK